MSYLRGVVVPMTFGFAGWLAFAFVIATATPLGGLAGMAIGELIIGIGMVAYWLRQKRRQRG